MKLLHQPVTKVILIAIGILILLYISLPGQIMFNFPPHIKNLLWIIFIISGFLLLITYIKPKNHPGPPLRQRNALPKTLNEISGTMLQYGNNPMGDIDKILLQQESVNLIERVTASLEILNNKMQSRQLSLKINLLPVDADFYIRVDAALMQVIIFNLMENAVKYAKEQTIITVTIEQTEENMSFNISNITDRELINIEKLTNEFEREDNYKQGFGLGL